MEEAIASRDARLGERDLQLAGTRGELRERVAEVAERGRRIEVLDDVAEHLAGLVVARDRELREVREELAELRARPESADADVDAEDPGHALERLESQVEEIWAQARGQATRIRMQALRQAAQLARGGNGGEAAVAVGDDATEGERERAAPGPQPAAPESANGRHPGRGVDVFDGLVHLEIGPLHDFSQLVRFEDAVTSLGAATEISVKRFSAGRATLAVRLERPVELLRELEEHSPFELTVRSLKDDRLIIDVDEH